MKLGVLFAAGASIAMFLSSAALADPFDRARNLLQSKQNEDSLAIIDSGQFDVNTQTDEGFSLLHYAAAAGNLEMVKALIARGADPAMKANDGFTPYSMASGTMVKAEIRKAMTSATATSNAGAKRPSKSAPASAAAEEGAPASRGTPGSNGMCASVRAEMINDGRSIAERPFLKAKDAVWYNHPDELVGLIEDCVSVDEKDRYGMTLLHHAADRDRVALAQILLDMGASRNIVDKDGNTAAAYATSPEMKALLGPAPKTGASARAGGTGSATADRKKECEQKYQANVALASDAAGRAASYRRWQQCLKTGLFW